MSFQTVRPQKRKQWSLILILLLCAISDSSRALAFSFSEIYRFPESYPFPCGLIFAPDNSMYGTCQGAGRFGYGSVFRIEPSGDVSTLVSFAGTNGSRPDSLLVLGGDGALYGTTLGGGSTGFGTVFRITTNAELTTLVSFTGTNAPCQGASPSGLLLGADGALYGCTKFYRTVFRVTLDGDFRVLASLPADVGLVNGTLTQGPDGSIYGTHQMGLFRVSSDGEVSTIASFNGTNGTSPMGRLLVGQDGVLYGTTYSGGQNNAGTVFRCTLSGGLTLLHSFAGDNDGSHPQTGLLQDATGDLYGATQLSPQTGAEIVNGTLFRITTNGTFETLLRFGQTNGSAPVSEMVCGPDGAFYGTTGYGGGGRAGTAFRLGTNGEFSIMAAFRAAGGISPESALLQDSDGNFWGTTTIGGTNGAGVVFCLSTNGDLLLSSSMHPSVGIGPLSSLIEAPDGGFYGAASRGGSYGFGSLFRISKDGQTSLLYAFDSISGANPCGPLVLLENGFLYGVTSAGGPENLGTIFRVSTNGEAALLDTFSGWTGGSPQIGLTRAPDGALYGTTTAGSPGTLSSGTAYRIRTNGFIEVIGSFNSSIGSDSLGPLLEHNGSLYGTVRRGPFECGSVFKITTNPAGVSLFALVPGYARGALAAGRDGGLYGMSEESNGGGYLYRINTNGTDATLAATIITFLEAQTGGRPHGGLTLARDGYLYGTTSFREGTVFRVDPTSAFKDIVKRGLGYEISFSALPEVEHFVQTARTPGGPWTTVTTISANAVGFGQYTNYFPAPDQGFFRLKVR